MTLDEFWKEVGRRGYSVTERDGKQWVAKPGLTPVQWNEETYNDLKLFHGEEVGSGLLDAFLLWVEGDVANEEAFDKSFGFTD